ncbi:glycosyltransferase [Fragilaria crotonensis]|nr:glycosyltransferase [Fragilaria crotonensis]
MLLWRSCDVMFGAFSSLTNGQHHRSLPLMTNESYSEYCAGVDTSDDSYVPRIVHQTYKSHDLPENFRMWRDECQRLNPCWEFRLWTDEDNLDLVRTSFPELLPTYEGYNLNIKRIDAARFMMLHKFGGVYMDLDLACIRSFNESTFQEPDTFYAAQQHSNWASISNRLQRVANAFMASPPRHPFLDKILQKLPTTMEEMVVCAAGPCFLTNAIDQEGQNETIVEYALKDMFSVSCHDDRTGLELCATNTTACKERYPGYLVSYWTHTWTN